MRSITLTLGRIVLYQWKADETLLHINAGLLSKSRDKNPLVSWVPNLRKYIILDGHHRIIEDVLNGKTKFVCDISEYQPKTYNLDQDTEILILKILKKFVTI